MDMNTQANARRVNKVLAANGRAERVQQGNGYFYFHSGEAMSWYTSSVPVCRISHCTVAEVIAEFNEMAGTSITGIPGVSTAAVA